MTNGIDNVSGYGNYGWGGYMPNRKENKTQNDLPPAPTPNHEETQVEPGKVMDFLAANNYFVALTETNNVNNVADVDDATRIRVESYMENFETIYGIIVNEFGEEMADDVMNIAMDRLLGLAA